MRIQGRTVRTEPSLIFHFASLQLCKLNEGKCSSLELVNCSFLPCISSVPAGNTVGDACTCVQLQNWTLHIWATPLAIQGDRLKSSCNLCIHHVLESALRMPFAPSSRLCLVLKGQPSIISRLAETGEPLGLSPRVWEICAQT